MPKGKIPSPASEVVELIRGGTRPLLALIGWVSWIALLFEIGFEDIPIIFTTLVYGMIAYYFGERGILKFKGKSQ